MNKYDKIINNILLTSRAIGATVDDIDTIDGGMCYVAHISEKDSLFLIPSNVRMIYSYKPSVGDSELYEEKMKPLLNLTGSLRVIGGSGLIDASYMFYDCIGLETINIRDLDLSNVEDLSGMFKRCRHLRGLESGGFCNADKVKYTREMFSLCIELGTLDISGLKTRGIREAYRMFEYCESLKVLDLSGFNIENIADNGLWGMFRGCRLLSDLDIRNFKGVIFEMGGMFEGCKSLKRVQIGNRLINL